MQLEHCDYGDDYGDNDVFIVYVCMTCFCIVC